MQFQTPLIKGTLIKRYKRFLADIELENGELVTAYCPNTGAMTGCAEPGYTVWLSPSTNPKRKLGYTWELAQTFGGDWIGVNTHNANKLVSEAINDNRISELSGYSSCTAEVKYGAENSRIDLLLQSEDRADCYVEVKSVTLARGQDGFFPDAKTARGSKHLRELMQIVEQQKRAVLLYCVQHSAISTVRVAAEIDPEYAQTLHTAKQVGVEIYAYGCHISQQKVELNQELKFICKKKG
ncbi:DNA/RNA nuclease SfsA [Aliiglaciecola sp. LCG003]|uniref:DNA/RNA nuclease SfsA n=1 Tax=Aliiglaciecola sp. LCG003 TaxID=3053655 RepID=UPI002573C301|nr:DNA/RNA nuclease SfsA [Aliiglaciecola sp. LCG003]WJG09142.1 DNA/RNA nuclease SfsA [Aliiglaciecola sp. LCG003]